MLYLKEHRAVAGLTQFELAVASGVSIRQLAYLEAGTKDPRLSTAQALAKALGLTLAELLAPPKRNGRKRRSA